jgi:hypothetical protein
LANSSFNKCQINFTNSINQIFITFPTHLSRPLNFLNTKFGAFTVPRQVQKIDMAFCVNVPKLLSMLTQNLEWLYPVFSTPVKAGKAVRATLKEFPQKNIFPCMNKTVDPPLLTENLWRTLIS